MNTLRLIGVMTLLVSIGLLQACATGPSRGSGFSIQSLNSSAADLNGTVTLTVNAGGTEVIVNNPENTQCKFAKKGKWKKGCFLVNKGHTAEINFDLDADQVDDYFIRTFMVCPWTKPEQTAEDKPGTPCNLGNAARMDFWVASGSKIAIPDANGIIDLLQFSGDVNSFTLNDNNVVKMDYFYWIEICPNGALPADDCPWADPGTRNGGRR